MLSVLITRRGGHKKIFGGDKIGLLPWYWWWFHQCMHTSKHFKLYPLNMCRFFVHQLFITKVVEKMNTALVRPDFKKLLYFLQILSSFLVGWIEPQTLAEGRTTRWKEVASLNHCVDKRSLPTRDSAIVRLCVWSRLQWSPHHCHFVLRWQLL